MDKSEKIILKERLDEKELSETKNYKKIKYSIAIITSTLIIAAVITLSIGHFKVEIIEEETKPAIRNLGFDFTASRTFNLGSFNVTGQTVSIKYVVRMTKTQCQNKIVITSGLGSFEFGNTGMSSIGKGSKNYTTQIFKFTIPNFYSGTIAGIAKGSLSWDIISKSANKYVVELSGELNLYAGPIRNIVIKRSCTGKGSLAKIKGKLIVSKGSITKDSDFSLGMGDLEINCIESAAVVHHYRLTLYKGWRNI